MKNVTSSIGIGNKCELSEKNEETVSQIPVPPPLPSSKVSTISVVLKPPTVDKTETISEEVQRLWRNREHSTLGVESPSQFALITLDSVLQEGPNCGLAALAMVATASTRKLTMNELFVEAKSLGFTHQGEMFSADNMAKLAESVLHPWFTVQLLIGGLSLNRQHIIKSLFEGGLMLVPYDAAGNYAPCCKSGHKSHWAVVCGIASVKDSSPDCYLFARQGKSKYMALWSFEQLDSSNMNLIELDPKRSSDGTIYILPDGGVKAGLLGKAILLYRKHKKPDITSFTDFC